METEQNPIFDTVAYGATQLQQLLILQSKDLMLRRWLVYKDQQDNSGGKIKALRALQSSVSILYEELRPRMKKKGDDKKNKDYDYHPDKLDALLEQKDYEKLARILIEYLELDLKLTQIDLKQQYDRTNIYFSNKIKGLI